MPPPLTPPAVQTELAVLLFQWAMIALGIVGAALIGLLCWQAKRLIADVKAHDTRVQAAGKRLTRLETMLPEMARRLDDVHERLDSLNTTLTLFLATSSRDLPR